MRAVFAAAVSLLLLLVFSAPARARQEPESFTTPVPVFEFHSGFWVNLHHFLYLQGRILRARAEAGASEAQMPAEYKSPASTEGLTAEQKRAWDAAVQTYANSWSSRDLLLNNQMVLINDRLAELEDCADLSGRIALECTSGIVPELVKALDAAAPIYRQPVLVGRAGPNKSRLDRGHDTIGAKHGSESYG